MYRRSLWHTPDIAFGLMGLSWRYVYCLLAYYRSFGGWVIFVKWSPLSSFITFPSPS
jgi:hypothetical protein